MRGIANQIRVNIEAFEKLGTVIHKIRVFGGGSKSSIWCRIIADVTGKEVCVPYTSETANLGAAIIASGESGICGSFEKNFSKMNLEENIYKPDAKLHEIYSSVFRRYIEIQSRFFPDE